MPYLFVKVNSVFDAFRMCEARSSIIARTLNQSKKLTCVLRRVREGVTPTALGRTTEVSNRTTKASRSRSTPPYIWKKNNVNSFEQRQTASLLRLTTETPSYLHVGWSSMRIPGAQLCRRLILHWGDAASREEEELRARAPHWSPQVRSKPKVSAV